MHRNYFPALILLIAVPMLACSLYRVEGQAVVAAADETTNETPTPAPTDLPIINDVEQVMQETPQPISTATALQPTRNLNDSITLPSIDQDGQASGGDTDQDNNEDSKDRPESAQSPPTATSTPIPSATATSTVTPSATPLAIALVGGWPPILPDATNLNQGDGYAIYQTGFDTTTVADFYRREMAAQGWAEFDFDTLVAEAGQRFVAPLQPMLDQGATILAFSQDGGDTLSFVFIFEATGQVQIVWATE